MKLILIHLNLLILVFAVKLDAQNCSSVITDDRTVAGTHLLRTAPETVVVRGNYSYSIEFSNEVKGVVGVVYSKGGEVFNQDDEIIFMDGSGTRKSYRFIEMGEMTRQSGTPVHKNVLQLDLAAINWFSKAQINTLYIKNNISNQMRKLTVNSNRQTAFRTMAICFLQNLDKTAVQDTPLVGNDFSSKSKSSTAATANASPSKSSSNISSTSASRPQNQNSGPDAELIALRKELKETKDKLRAEILAEKEKADNIKAQIQNEMPQQPDGKLFLERKNKRQRQQQQRTLVRIDMLQ